MSRQATPRGALEVLASGQQKSVATDSKQMIWTIIWQRISPIAVAILLI